MGIFVGWVVRGRRLFIAGFLVLILAFFIPGSNQTIRLAAFFLALALILVQLVMVFREGFRAREVNRPPQRPDS